MATEQHAAAIMTQTPAHQSISQPQTTAARTKGEEGHEGDEGHEDAQRRNEDAEQASGPNNNAVLMTRQDLRSTTWSPLCSGWGTSPPLT